MAADPNPRSPNPRRPRLILGRLFPVLAALGLFGAIVLILLIRQPWTQVSPPDPLTENGNAISQAGEIAVIGETRQIAFMSNRDGDWDLYELTLGTGQIVNLTNTTEDEAFPTYSADGGAVTYISNRDRLAGDETELTAYLMNADGSEQRRVVNDLGTIMNILGTGRLNWDVRQSPAGQTLVSLRDLNLEVYAGEVNISQNGAVDWYGAQNMAGAIVFASDREQEQQDIYLYLPGEEGVRRLTDAADDEIYPVWAADGRQIIYFADRGGGMDGGRTSLYALDTTSDTPRGAVLEGALTTLDGSGAALTIGSLYASDAVAQVYMAYDGDWELFYLSSDGGVPVKVTENDSDDLFPVWRPASE